MELESISSVLQLGIRHTQDSSTIDVSGLQLITRFSVTGNSSIKLLSRHLIKWAVSNAALKVIVDGSTPNVKVLANVIANNPQSALFFCCCTDLVTNELDAICFTMSSVIFDLHKLS